MTTIGGYKPPILQMGCFDFCLVASCQRSYDNKDVVVWQKHQSTTEKRETAISFRLCPAKTYMRPNDGEVVPGRSVLEHCTIVGEVARVLVARYPKKLAAHLFAQGSILAAAAHDIGKVSPYFYQKLRREFTAGAESLETLSNINPELERGWGGHAGVSQLTAKALDTPEYVAEILGQHHGFSPRVSGLRATDTSFGGPAWQQERESLVTELKQVLQSDWPTLNNVPQARVLAGLTTVADWIGSGRFFEDPSKPWRKDVDAALNDAGFIAPTYQHELSFDDVFGFSPRPAQQQLIEAITGPGLYVFEAPMGLGKTEAALYAAYRMLESGQASGVYFALPTQLTSNKIYERFNAFLAAILAPDCNQRSLLLHAKAWLVETEMGEEGRPGGAWFNHAKRGLLAPFAVGTIDQALMAAMNVKHGFVRAFGLAGKVVILDEIHTYDAYTSTLLNSLIEQLRQLQCTVIILSATLSLDRRQQLMQAEVSEMAYPLVSAAPTGQPVTEWKVPEQSGHSVSVRLLAEKTLAIDEALKRASQGQQVLWIENTVTEAQERYFDIAARAAELGVACGLLHSRFTADDRQRLEQYWVNVFGKDGWEQRRQQGRVLVGTQILEQSLDIDADFLVTRFAPTDMLLQRFGRLWRHQSTPRPADARCEAWVLAPDLAPAIESPFSAFANSAYVYSPYVLCRSLEVWKPIVTLSLPQDIRYLIEQTYAPKTESGPMSQWLHELEYGNKQRKGRKALAQLARVTLAEDGQTLPECKAQTRYSEQDTIELLLLRSVELLKDQRSTRLTLLDGSQWLLPHSRHVLDKHQWRTLTASLMRQTLLVRPHEAPDILPLDTLKKLALHHCFYLGNPADDEATLRVGIVDELGEIKGLHGAKAHPKWKLEYRDDVGYRVIKEHV